MTTAPPNRGPLAGVRVLDLGQGVAGPYCAKLMADQGADVIKLEPPRGDWGRTLGHSDPETGLSSTFIAINRGKRSVCLDLRDHRAADAARQLAGTCEVIIESFRTGVTERLGIGYGDIQPLRPDVVYCSITGFGASGPHSESAASDSMMQAYGGLMSITGQPSEPLRVGTVVSDMLAGANAFSAVLLALLRRTHDHRGARVEVNLLDSLLAFQATNLVEYLITGQVPEPIGNRHPLIGAAGVARTQSGWIAVGILDHHWAAFCDLVKSPLLQDPRFASGEDRRENRDALWQALDTVFDERPSEEWVALLRPAGIVCSPVQDYSTLLDDPQVRHNGMVTRLAGGIHAVESPFRLDGVPSWSESPPPQLGEHTQAILSAELGLAPDEISRLIGIDRTVGIAS